jgi:hypothetical protein
MPKGREIREEIGEGTGVPISTINLIDRKLSEADLVPRGGRGPNASNYDTRHAWNVCLGTMIVADGISSTVARIAKSVRRFADMPLRAKPKGSLPLTFVSGCTFGDAGAAILGAVTEPIKGAATRKHLYRVGLIFGRHVSYGYIDVVGPDGTARFIFCRPGDDWQKAGETGLVRKVHIPAVVMMRLAELFADSQPAEPTLFDILQGSATTPFEPDTETTTPAAGGAGPAKSLVSQPRANAAISNADAQHQDSVSEEREQCSTPYAALGLPSVDGSTPPREGIEPPWHKSVSPTRCVV